MSPKTSPKMCQNRAKKRPISSLKIPIFTPFTAPDFPFSTPLPDRKIAPKNGLRSTPQPAPKPLQTSPVHRRPTYRHRAQITSKNNVRGPPRPKHAECRKNALKRPKIAPKYTERRTQALQRHARTHHQSSCAAGSPIHALKCLKKCLKTS